MDKKYWEEFYAKINAMQDPSLFAQFVYNYKKTKHMSLLELGCGNGRDAMFFAKQEWDVTAIDQCQSEIDRLSALANGVIKFNCDDFTNLKKHNSLYDIVYSRFTLHSITAVEEDRVLNWTYANLKNGGEFCIEVRGKKNELFQKGVADPHEKDAYIYDEHFRRFLHFETFCKKLENLGFKIAYAEEAKGFAPFKDTDETFIRIIAQK